jgi:hypothetical protein
MSTTKGYRVNMRVDTRTGEHLAVIADAYNHHQGRYYMAIGESDGCWCELDPKYLTRATVTTDNFPEWLKRRMDSSIGYVMQLADRLYGR